MVYNIFSQIYGMSINKGIIFGVFFITFAAYKFATAFHSPGLIAYSKAIRRICIIFSFLCL